MPYRLTLAMALVASGCFSVMLAADAAIGDATAKSSGPAADLTALLARWDDPRRHGQDTAATWDLQAPWETTLNATRVPKEGGVVCWMRPTGCPDGITVDVTVTGSHPLTGRVILYGGVWRRVWLPVRALKIGEVRTTEEGAVLRLQTAGTAPTQASIAIAGVRVIDHPWEITGPSLDDEGFLAALDWSRPDLQPALTRMLAGDQAGALAAVATVVRRPITGWTWPSVTTSTATAERLLKGDVTVGSLSHTFPNQTIDWLANPTRGSSATHEWVWSLNRHASWWEMADAYRSTGKVAYAQGWARLMRSWVQQAAMPTIQDETAGSVWRDLEAGLRLNRTWADSFQAVCQEPTVSDAEIFLLLRSVWDHGTYLTSCPYHPGNHFILGKTGLYNAGALFPWFHDSQRWRRVAGAFLQQSMDNCTLDEGGWYELAPGYGMWVANKLLEVWDFAELTGTTAELPEALRVKVRRMCEWGVRLVAPNGTVPMLNDGGPLTFASMRLDRSSRRFPESELLTWARAAEANTPAKAPSWTSERLPESGYVTMRTGWTSRDSYLLLDTGPLGGWHGHQDALNLVAWFQGRYFLFDNGGYKYDSSDWRKWGPSTAAHNTVLVDGLGQIRTWNSDEDPIGALPKDQHPARFGASPAADYASGWYMSGYGDHIPGRGKASNPIRTAPAIHRREVLFVKSTPTTVTIVLDTLIPDAADSHRYEVRWHVKSTQWSTADQGAVTWTTDPGQPNLAIISLGGADEHHANSGVKEPELLGWWFENQNDAPVPALTLRRQRTISGTTRILTVLAPFTGDPTANPVLSYASAGADAWTLHLRGAATPLTIHLRDAGLDPSLSVDGIALPDIH